MDNLAEMTNPLDLVDQFHKAFNYRQPTPVSPALDDDTIALRINLLTEEKDELFQAIADDSRIEMLDACCDFQYVLSGAILALGLRNLFETSDSAIHGLHDDSNSTDRFKLTARATLISIKIKYLGNNLQRGAIAQSVLCFSDLQRQLDAFIKTADLLSVFKDAFVAVHQNNMAKLWDYDTAMMGNWPDLTFEASNEAGKYIARRSDGKIIKPPGFVKVDLSEFVK